jgi:N-succinyldiaminopimelate aminotransferase
LKESRDFLHAALAELGFGLGQTRGTYFILADHRPVSGRIKPGMTGREFSRWLPEHAGVAAIPASAFYEHKELGEPLVRFAFCKKMETLREGVARLRRALK